MKISQLWRYPVKSMLGEACESLELDERGVRWDRGYALRRFDGKLGSGKDSTRFCAIEGLFEFRARLEGGVPIVTFPGGREWSAEDAGIHGELSRVLGVELTLSPEGDVAHMDAGAVHLVTGPGMRWLTEESGSSSCDPLRFRPNLMLEFKGHGPVEHDWTGRELHLGSEARLTIAQATTRCVMTGFAQGDLPTDNEPIKQINRQTDGLFGVYGSVLTCGRIRVGDTVQLK
jgi:uncharacterized protein YcbX